MGTERTGGGMGTGALVLVAATMVLDTVAGQTQLLRRCYVCRSRGELGDCRDTFIPPPPTDPGIPVQVKPVAEEPCSSGWCLKILEGVDKNFSDDDFGIATERQCMQRAPSDHGALRLCQTESQAEVHVLL